MNQPMPSSATDSGFAYGSLMSDSKSNIGIGLPPVAIATSNVAIGGSAVSQRTPIAVRVPSASDQRLPGPLHASVAPDCASDQPFGAAATLGVCVHHRGATNTTSASSSASGAGASTRKYMIGQARLVSPSSASTQRPSHTPPSLAMNTC